VRRLTVDWPRLWAEHACAVARNARDACQRSLKPQASARSSSFLQNRLASASSAAAAAAAASSKKLPCLKGNYDHQRLRWLAFSRRTVRRGAVSTFPSCTGLPICRSADLTICRSADLPICVALLGLSRRNENIKGNYRKEKDDVTANNQWKTQ
jgi:hypothetical protein